MASTSREKQLARLRAERQAARRAAEAARRKRRTAIAASVVAVVAVAGGATYLATRGGSDTKAVASPPATSASPASAAPGSCAYTPAGTASRKVTLPPAQPAAKGRVTATVTTDKGVVGLALDGGTAPCATGAIVSLAAQKFYDGTPCHRLTTEGIFVLQCGDPSGTGSGGPGFRYAEEGLTGATYKRGTVAMAKTSAPGTTGSQFFLVYKDSDLPPQYTPVGTITSGLDVLDKVAAAGSDPAGDGKPKLPVQITSFTTAAA